MLTSLMPVWEAQEEREQFQHPESPLWGILSDAEAAHVISSDGLNGHRVADFPPPFPLLIPLKDLGPWKPMSGKTLGVLHSVPLVLWQLDKSCSSYGTQFLICETEIWTKQEIRGVFVFVFLHESQLRKSKMMTRFGKCFFFLQFKMKMTLREPKAARKLLNFSLVIVTNIYYMWGLDCAQYCAKCLTCLRWFSEAFVEGIFIPILGMRAQRLGEIN